MYIIHNDELIQNNELFISSQNRSFRYGDGLFESIRIINGQPFLLSKHIERLQNDMITLKMECESMTNFENIHEKIELLCKKNFIEQGGRVRLNVYRNNGGYYTPDANSVSYILEVNAHADNLFLLNKKGLNIDVYNEIKKPLNKLSSIKSNNSLLYVLASIYKKQKALDDCLLLNEENNISEATSANLFMVTDNKIYTPGLDQACLNGTMRKLIIKLARESGYKIYECNLKTEDLIEAEELFLTNAVSGIKWVSGFRKKRYFKNVATKLISKLNDFACS